MVGVRHTDFRNGVKDWELDAESADYQIEENKAFLSMLQATYFDNRGDGVFLSAKSGTWKTDSNDLEVTGNVVLKNSQCEMQTDRLIFNKNEQIFVTKSPVTLTTPAFSLHRESMTYSLETGIITLDENVEVPF
jgi:LPS export ABC transporter protein LptC